MTIYVGENILITHTATMDGVELTDVDVDRVAVTIYDPEGEVLIDETEMIWDPVQDRWAYNFDTSPGATPFSYDPGTYRVKVVVYSGSNINYEFKKLKLKRTPV